MFLTFASVWPFSLSLHLSLSFSNQLKRETTVAPSENECFHLTIFSHQPVGTFCSILYLLFNFISTLTDFEGWCYVLWLKVSHAVRMGKQLSKCERNPREYSHTQNVTTMQNNPGAERLSVCSLIEDTMLCEQGHASSLRNNKKFKWGLIGPLLKGGHKPHPVCVNDVKNSRFQVV